jgi:glutamate 5-kinase
MPQPMRIVIKVGTSTLTNPAGELDLNFMRSLVQQLSAIRAPGRQIALVTSGAVRAGLKPLGLKAARTIRESQAAAAVGQSLLMRTYADFFRDEGLITAQILLTRDDLADRRRYLNARNTLLTLFERGVVPIINENDTVATDELKHSTTFGDNDTLAAQVTSLMGADLLVLLTDVEGFYVSRPDGTLQLLSEVTQITPELEEAARGTSSAVGKGGMATKLAAAKTVTHFGTTVVIAHGREPQVVERVVRGEKLGTWFHPRGRKLDSRRRWIGFSGPLRGALVIDRGARQMLLEQGKSLLPVGIVEVHGEFNSGDVVRLLDEQQQELGRGLVNYNAAEIRRLQGHRSEELERILGYQGDAEVIHRDNMTLIP